VGLAGEAKVSGAEVRGLAGWAEWEAGSEREAAVKEEEGREGTAEREEKAGLREEQVAAGAGGMPPRRFGKSPIWS